MSSTQFQSNSSSSLYNTQKSNNIGSALHYPSHAREKPLPPAPSLASSPRLDRFKKKVANLWLQEILFWLISVTLTVGLMITLRVHQNQAVPDWPYHITLNSVISLLTALARASMLEPLIEPISQLKWLWFTTKARPLSHFNAFDEASRGAWGSFKLLRLAHRAPMSSLGALVIILSFAIDPFAQQVVNYPGRRVFLGTAPSIQFTQDYGDTASFGGAGPPGPSLEVKAALINGIYGSGSIRAPACPSGDCTWDRPYSSLAICAACEDITSQADVVEFVPPFNINADDYNPTPPWKACNVTLPSGMKLAVWGNTDFFFNMTTAKAPTTRTNSSEVVKVSIIKSQSLAKTCNITATECSLKFCVQTYNASFERGQFQENILSSYADTAWETKGTNLTFRVPSSQKVTDQADIFTVTEDSLDAFIAYMSHIFNGTGVLNLSSGENPFFVSNTENACYTKAGFGQEFTAPAIDASQMVYDSDDVLAFFERLARSVTAGIRIVSTHRYKSNYLQPYITQFGGMNGTM